MVFERVPKGGEGGERGGRGEGAGGGERGLREGRGEGSQQPKVPKSLFEIVWLGTRKDTNNMAESLELEGGRGRT